MINRHQLSVAAADEGILLGGMRYRGPIALEVSHYAANGGPLALILITYEDGYPERLAVATVNIPGETPMPNCVFIKDHSENEGMAALLEVKEWGRPTGRRVPSGFVVIPEFELTGDLLRFVDTQSILKERV